MRRAYLPDVQRSERIVFGGACCARSIEWRCWEQVSIPSCPDCPCTRLLLFDMWQGSGRLIGRSTFGCWHQRVFGPDSVGVYTGNVVDGQIGCACGYVWIGAVGCWSRDAGINCNKMGCTPLVSLLR